MSTKTKIRKSEIKTGCAKSYQIGDNKIVICNIDGEYYAIEDICSHDNGELVTSEGELLEECQIQCPRHGAKFDVRTGEAKRMPAIAPIKTYKIVDRKDEIEVEVGN